MMYSSMETLLFNFLIGILQIRQGIADLGADNKNDSFNGEKVDDTWSIIMAVNSKLTGTVLNDDDGTFSSHGRYRLMEGDIRSYEGEQRQEAPKKKKLIPPFDWHRRMWGRIIPYDIHDSLKYITKMIETELRKIESKTCLTFRRKRSSDRQWILYNPGNDCSSRIGRPTYYNGSSDISLAPLCRNPSLVTHETLHALGFFHEQGRSDRDSFVRLYEHKIREDSLIQYEKESYSLLLTPYDYRSIMHYSKTTFKKYNVEGNTIEHKFDPNHQLGGKEMTESDYKDINLLYQCDKVKSGWSRWSGFSPCLKNDWRECVKANVRFCTSSNWAECPNHNQFGAQERVVECDMNKCDNPKVDGIWGNWGAFSKCSTQCGWGHHTRYRKCDNPAPRNGGKACPGTNKQQQMCRRRRCNQANAGDIDFESGKKKWSFDGFFITAGKASSENSGPSNDHSSSLSGTARGRYALASKRKTTYINKIATLKSPWIYSLLSNEKCVVFHYMLNGKMIHPNALGMFAEFQSGGRRMNLPFLIGGHHGNYWKRAAVKIPPMNKPFRFVFESRFYPYGKADIAIDDVFLDHVPCMTGLQGCRDHHSECSKWAEEKKCIQRNPTRYLLATCCSSCSNPDLLKCEDKNKKCLQWSKNDECKKNPTYMLKSCCKSCKDPDLLKCEDENEKCLQWSKTDECKKNPTYMWKSCCKSCKQREDADICINENNQCSKWASRGECDKNKSYMLDKCCKACKEVPNKKCINKAKTEVCNARGRAGDCNTKVFKKFMNENCCATCKQLANPTLCNGTSNIIPRCIQWAKQGECKKYPWVLKYCCPACKLYA